MSQEFSVGLVCSGEDSVGARGCEFLGWGRDLGDSEVLVAG